MRPIELALPASVNHRLPSAPVAMRPGLLPDGMTNSVTSPVGVIFPILWTSCSVNHRLPSGPSAMPVGLLAGVGMPNSLNAPAGESWPILFAPTPASVNHRLPSLPATMASGALLAVGTVKSLNCLSVPTRDTLLCSCWVNQSAMSGPRQMPAESPPAGTPNSSNAPEGWILPMPPCFVYQRLPSGPGAMPRGPTLVMLTLYSLNGMPALSTLLTALGFVLWCVNQTL